MSSVGKGICCYCGGEGINDSDPDICINCAKTRVEFRASFSKKDIDNQKFTCLMKDGLFNKAVSVSVKMNITQFNEFFEEFLNKPEFSQIMITKYIVSTKNKIGVRKESKKQ